MDVFDTLERPAGTKDVFDELGGDVFDDVLDSAEAIEAPAPISGSISGSEPIPEPEPIPDVAPENRARVDADVAAAQAVMGAQMLPYRVDATSIRSPEDRMRAAREAEALSSIAKTRESNTDMFDPAHYEAMDEAGLQQRRADGIYARLATDFPAKKSEEEQRAEFEAQFQKDINERGDAPDAVQTFMHWLVSKGKNVAASALEPVAPDTAKNLRDSASDDTYIGQLGTGASQKVARGAADVAFLVGGNPAGVLGIGVATAKAALDTYSRVLNETKDRHIAMDEAVKTAPAMALYMAGGAVGAGLGKALVPVNSAPTLRGLGALSGAMLGNVAPSMAMRIAEGDSYGIEALTADTLLAMFHAYGQYKGAVSERAQKRAEAELLSRGFSQQQIKQGYEEGGFRMRTDTPAALVAPMEVQIDLRAKGMVDAAKESAEKLLNPDEKPPPSQQPREATGKAPDAPTPAPEGGAQPESAIEGVAPEPERRLGPGAANIEEFPPLRKIGAYNAAVDAQRAERGLSPIMSEARKADTVTWDNAERRIEADPDLPARLVEEINTGKKTSVNDEEQSALLWRIIDLRNRKQWEIERAIAEDATPEIIAESQARYDAIEQDLQRTEEADRKSGTMQGRALRIRRMLINEDHTFGGMMGRAQMAKGEKLTPQETQQIKEQADQYSKADKAFEERQRKLEEEQPVDQAIKDIEAEASKNPDFTPEVRSLADRIVSRLDQAASAALSRLRSKFAQTNIGADPSILADLVVYGSAKIAKGFVKFGRWAAEMVKDMGEGVKPYLQDAWTGANRNIDAEVQAMGGKNKAKVKDAVAKTPAVSKAEEIGAAIKARVDGGEKLGDLTGSIQRLVETLVRGGIKTRDPLVDAVHDVLQKIDPKITRREAMDAISGYGSFKPLNKDTVKAEVRDLKGQLQQVAKLEDIQSKVPLSRTGVERRVPSGEERDLIQQVNEAKRKFGVVVTDPASQLKSVLDGIETRLKNQIEDIVRQLEKAEGPRAKTPAPTNDKIEALRGLRDRLRDTLESVSGKGRTEEQRLSAFKQHANRRIAELEKRIRKSDFGPRPKRQPLDLSRDPQAVRAKAQMEGIKKEFQKRQFAWTQAQRKLHVKIWDGIKETVASTRSIITSMDVSAPFRQGGFLLMGDLIFHPVRAAKQIGSMFRQLVSEKGFQDAQAAILLRPNAKLYDQSKLYLADMDGKLSAREESMRSNLAEKIPIVGRLIRASNRAYSGFLNRQRADSFDAMVEAFGGSKITPEQARAIADFINTVTGRGTVLGMEQSANALARYFFSPRFLASRFQLVLGQPLVASATRKFVAQQYAKFAIGLAAVYGLATLAGGSVEKDPRSADFGKAKFGDARIDPMSGLAQVTVFMTRFLSGKTKVNGEIKDKKRSDTFTRFARTKLAPIPGIVADFAAERTLDNQKPTLGESVQRLTVPMSYQDMPEVYREQGALKGTIMEALNLMGMGLQHYGR